MSGIFGVTSKKDCVQVLFYGTDYHSHLGTEFGGLAVLGEKFTRQIHDISQSQFKAKFFLDIQNMRGDKGIGVISAADEQPIYLRSKFGPFCLVFNGIIENAEALAKDLLSKGLSFSEVSKGLVNPAELVAKLLTQGEDIIDGIEKAFSVIEGSCSLLILNKDGIYAACDRLGYNPLVIGKNCESWAVTSETTAFLNFDYETVKFLEPGEIILLTADGITQKVKGREKKQVCTFLWIYTGFPSSDYEGINVEMVRERCGRCLARGDKDLKIDLVCGVPDSGVAHAIGYAMESGVPLRRPLVKYTPGYGRSYTPPSQETRDLVAKMKLVGIKEVINGQKIALCEDSIVRGTQLKNFAIKKLWDNGAKEVHVRPACPPLMFPCKFNLSTRNINELAARRAIRSLEGSDVDDVFAYTDHANSKYKKMVEWIRKDLEVTTLRYQTVEDMVEAVGMPKKDLCLYCWTGENPGAGVSKKAKIASSAYLKEEAIS